MSRPEWLDENERDRRIRDRANRCISCASFFGRHVGTTRHRGTGERIDVVECALHPGCMNTKYSLACKDFSPR